MKRINESKWYTTWKHRISFRSELDAIKFCTKFAKLSSVQRVSFMINDEDRLLNPYFQLSLVPASAKAFIKNLRRSLRQNPKKMSDDWKTVQNLFGQVYRFPVAPAVITATIPTNTDTFAPPAPARVSFIEPAPPAARRARRRVVDRFDEAVELARSWGGCTISALQEEMHIGYDQAKNYMDRMTAMGLLSQPGYPGSTRPRKFLAPASAPLAPAAPVADLSADTIPASDSDDSDDPNDPIPMSLFPQLPVNNVVQRATSVVDDRFDEAVKIVRSLGHCTISGLQREMHIGHDRALKIVKMLVEKRIIDYNKHVIPNTSSALASMSTPVNSQQINIRSLINFIEEPLVKSSRPSVKEEGTYLDILLRFVSLEELINFDLEVRSKLICSFLDEKEVAYCKKYDNGHGKSYFRGNMAEWAFAQFLLTIGHYKKNQYLINIARQLINKMRQSTGSSIDCEINGVPIDIKSTNPKNPILYRVGDSQYYPIYDIDYNEKNPTGKFASATLIAIPSLETIKTYSQACVDTNKNNYHAFDINAAKQDLIVDHENFFTNVLKLGK